MKALIAALGSNRDERMRPTLAVSNLTGQFINEKSGGWFEVDCTLLREAKRADVVAAPA
jgi:hypothetical protein